MSEIPADVLPRSLERTDHDGPPEKDGLWEALWWGYDVGALLTAKGYDPVKMVRTGEAFYSSLGFAPLPDTFWNRRVVIDQATSFRSPETIAGSGSSRASIATADNSASRPSVS